MEAIGTAIDETCRKRKQEEGGESMGGQEVSSPEARYMPDLHLLPPPPHPPTPPLSGYSYTDSLAVN